MPVLVLDDSDMVAVIRLWERAGLTRPWNPPEQDFRRALRGPSSTLLGLVEEDVLVAAVMVGHDGHRGWVYYLAVDPARRGTGAGRLMMSGAEDWLRAAGVPKVQLMVRRENRSAAGFYRHLGYDDADVEVLARWLDDG